MNNSKNNLGSGIVEAIIAIAIMAIFLSGTVFLFVANFSAFQTYDDQIKAQALAQEGIEALTSIRNKDWCNMTAGTHGLKTTENGWVLHNDDPPYYVDGKFSRAVTIFNVFRDANQNIVSSDQGTVDPNSKDIVVVVFWNDASGNPRSVSIKSILTNWQSRNATKEGLLVYTSTEIDINSIFTYRVLNSDTRTWGEPMKDASMPVKGLFKLYSAPDYNEKILVSYESDYSGAKVQASVYTPCHQWSDSIVLHSGDNNFKYGSDKIDGTYLTNGDFMVVYHDETNLPKFRIWNHDTWTTAGIPLPTLDPQGYGLFAINNIILKSRPGTNEVMAVFQQYLGGKIVTMYFNGGGYLTENWSSPIEHAAASRYFREDLTDFNWSKTDGKIGALIYADKYNDDDLNMKIFTADLAGEGSWSLTDETTPQPGLIQSVRGVSNINEDAFIGCYRGLLTNQRELYCYDGNFDPTWTQPVNNIISDSADVRTAFDIAFEQNTGAQEENALTVYQDSGATPLAKTYTPTTQTWDSDADAIVVDPSLLPADEIKLIPDDNTGDIMVLIDYGRRGLYSKVWDGNTDAFYTSDDAFGLTDHEGKSISPDIWYDFVWE